LAKIAVNIEGAPASRLIAKGNGWSVHEVMCDSGPRDRPFEEQRDNCSLSLVLGGTFQYRSSLGRALMTPGAVLLGKAGECFECSHEHGVGDHCISFRYSPQYLDALKAPMQIFDVPRIPPLRSLSAVFAKAHAKLSQGCIEDWENISLQLVSSILDVTDCSRSSAENTLAAEGRITRALRLIESHCDGTLELSELAQEAKLSPYHFLRLFQRLTLLTPHQYIMRVRLRRAAICLALSDSNIIEIAGECGFSDVSNFNRAFRAEFGMSPRQYRR
jgi:AraC family transcriptional regulator